jgi:hypothetical protein
MQRGGVEARCENLEKKKKPRNKPNKIDDLAPRLDTTRARLEQLGPKPRTSAEESADATKERAEREGGRRRTR